MAHKLKTILHYVLAIAALSLSSAYGQSQTQQITQTSDLRQAIKRVDALAAAEIAADNIGSINIAIVSGGNLVWTKSYGYADVERKIPITKDNVFAIGSITKQFTALMLLQLVEQGKVRLSDPVEKYLPEVKKLQNQFVGAPPITLIQLATHTSGLDREPDDEQMLYIKGHVPEWDKKLITTIPLTRFINEPGTRYSYSNIGYAILGAALSKAAGEPYVEYVQKRILKPLGMSQTAFLLDNQMKKNRAKGFLIENGKADAEEPERQVRDGRGWRIPSGGLYSTVEDLARFVAFELGEENTTILSKKTLEANFRRVYSALSDFNYGYGIGFQFFRRGNLNALGHTGVLAGYQCSAWIDPKTRLGVITLTTKQEKELGLRALEILVAAGQTSNKQ
ncbi:MAG: beta-lactamase family protein [Acidobacteriota bacterium]|jgi:CubicO group peptidase (beta-lactamase class C family)|nr:beta-lactamase family protein [Acidobacteriota bacterium]